MPRPGSIFVALLALACSGPASPPPTSIAPAPPTSTAAVPEPVATRPSWLYRVETQTEPSYLFVMLDPGCPLFESFPDDYEILFRFARVLVLPVGWTDDEMRAFAARTMSPGNHLDRDLGPTAFATFVTRSTLPEPVAALFEPFAALSVYSSALATDVYGTGVSDGRLSPSHDATIRRRAASLPIVSLMTPDDAYTSAERLGARPLRGTLVAMLEHDEEARADYARRLSAYREGDEEALAQVVLSATIPGTERYVQAVLAENQRFLATALPTVERELRAGSALVMLPADVALGTDGALAGLRAAGLTLERIAVAAPAE